MKARDLKELNIPTTLAQVAGLAVRDARSTGVIKKSDIRPTMTRLSENPHEFLEDKHFGELAVKLIEMRGQEPDYVAREERAPYQQWGTDIEAGAIEQMDNACDLPVSVRGALMPDAHQGYGLPIGGVLAVENAVIPYAVGVDIACRMKLSVYDLSPIILNQEPKKFEKVLQDETRFGMACTFRE